ncbi:tautomerase family protein [Segeticoccus rhizosphaerae]|uniref:tautomerase family protein n=1 Tax=Segeticoccus rhizosphaerae TaxID=1104777 RepID=UPI00126440EA|nr:tautomerase family protein [Segeticoccus rhizosphaerae]
MPIVEIKMYPGRDETVKGFIARGVTDLVAETAGTSREGVHVVFTDVEKSDWAVGPRLTSARQAPPPNKPEAAFVSVSRIKIQSDKHSEYLAWRRHSVYPFMASHDGFLGSTLLTTEDPDTYVIINKWRDSAAQEEYTANPRETQLRVEAKEFVSELAAETFHGDVVDVWNA